MYRKGYIDSTNGTAAAVRFYNDALWMAVDENGDKDVWGYPEICMRLAKYSTETDREKRLGYAYEVENYLRARWERCDKHSQKMLDDVKQIKEELGR